MQGGAVTSETPQEIKYTSVATAPSGAPVSLSVTNVSMYEAWNPEWNGLHTTGAGSFGIFNMRAPRDDRGPLPEDETSVTLRFSFLDGLSGAPIALPRTHFTFVDLDNSRTSQECITIHDADGVRLAEGTELTQLANATTGAHTFCGSTVGKGADNPADPTLATATTQQRQRSVMITLVGRAHFDVSPLRGPLELMRILCACIVRSSCVSSGPTCLRERGLVRR